LLSQKKETKEKATPLPLVSFGLSAASGRLRNSCFQHSNKSSPLSIFWLKPQARQGDLKSKPCECHLFVNLMFKYMLCNPHGYCLAGRLFLKSKWIPAFAGMTNGSA
jgi:hypothetical protein